MIPFPWSDSRQGRSMMGRLNHDQEQFFYSFRLDEAVPQDHPVREVAVVLDLSWVHSELAPYYPRLGRTSIDPVLTALLPADASTCAVKGSHRASLATKAFFGKCQNPVLDKSAGVSATGSSP